MVSEPNFVLGIKQKSLASKEDSHVRNTDPQQCACLLSHLGLQQHAATTETPLLPRCYISDLSSKSNHSPIRSVHIKPSPVETEPTAVLLGLPRRKPRNPVNRKLATRRHAPQLAPENLPRAASDAWLSDHDRAHTPPWRPPQPPIYRTWDSGPHPTIHALSRASRISGIFFTRRWTEHAPDTHRTLLLMSSDVTRWRHHTTPAATQARPRQP